MFDVVVIGNGPAGISAALYTLRANLKTAIVSVGLGSLKKAHLIENYYGVGAVSGTHLHAFGVAQATELGGEIITAEVLNVAQNDENFIVDTTLGKHETRAVIIACGFTRVKSGVKTLDEFKGSGVSSCAVCDGFFYKDKDVGVLGSGSYAVNEANYLKNLAKTVTIFTDGQKLAEELPSRINLINEAVESVEIEENVLTNRQLFKGVKCDSGKVYGLDGLFLAVGTASAVNFAQKLGIITNDKGNILVDDESKTNIGGVFACGDCTGGVAQIGVAVGSGVVCGLSVIKYLRKG